MYVCIYMFTLWSILGSFSLTYFGKHFSSWRLCVSKNQGLLQNGDNHIDCA